MAGPAAPSGARFVCKPSDNVELAFKTVRAQPRPANAQPEMETLLNVPVDELEEMLLVALQRARQFLDKCDYASKGLALIATRVEAEFAARTRDIQATSTFVHRVSGRHLDAFCREISVPGRKLRATPVENSRFPHGLGVAATLEKEDGGNWGPVDAMNAIDVAGAAADHECQSTKEQVVALMQEERESGSVKKQFKKQTEVTHAGNAFYVQLEAMWTPQKPNVLNLDTLPDRHPGTKSGRTEDLPRLVAELVQGLRNLKFAERVSVSSLVPPTPDGVAARLRGVEQDWDVAGRFPAVSLTIIQANLGNPRAVLILPEGMQWGVSPDACQPQSPRLVGEIVDSEAFCRCAPADLPWRLVASKFSEMDALAREHETHRLVKGFARLGPEQTVMNLYAASLWKPNGMASATANFNLLLHRVRCEDDPPPRENAPQDEVEEMLAVALHRVCATMMKPCLQGAHAVVLTRIDSECWAHSRDLQATSTLLMNLGLVGASAFCSAIDAEGRGLRAEPSGGSKECMFTVPLEVDGRSCGTVDCTEFVDADRAPLRLALLSAIDATDSSMVHPRVYTCLREVVEVGGGPGNADRITVTGSFVKDVPDKIFLAAPRKRMSGSDASKPRKLARFQGGDFLSPDFFAKLIVRALRRPGALRAISAGALLAPLSAVDVSAHAREEAWGPNGEFPAVSVNIAMVCSPTGPQPLVWLGLPRGMRWRVAGRNKTTGLTQLVAEVASRADVVLEHSLSFGTTWDAIARAAHGVQAMVRDEMERTFPGHGSAPLLRTAILEAQQAILNAGAVPRALDYLPFDRAEEYRRIRAAAAVDAT
ncbi:unnamed protein product [Pedinophyceae sp. YPF-701]|nr:unnamed protein product [Pedinophyceae sp. YPF-701]